MPWSLLRGVSFNSSLNVASCLTRVKAYHSQSHTVIVAPAASHSFIQPVSLFSLIIVRYQAIKEPNHFWEMKVRE